MVSQARVDRPCLFRQQPTDQDVHVSRVCFLEQEYDKQLPAGSSQQNQCERLFSGVPHASGSHLFISERAYALLR
jgi:hypothetical protein